MVPEPIVLIGQLFNLCGRLAPLTLLLHEVVEAFLQDLVVMLQAVLGLLTFRKLLLQLGLLRKLGA